MNRHLSRAASVGLFISMLGGTFGTVHANGIPHKSVAEMVAASDAVFVGVVVDTEVFQRAPLFQGGFKCEVRLAEVRPQKSPGGDQTATIKVVTHGCEPESDLARLSKGKRYLFFLTRAADGLYDAVAGPASAMPMDGSGMANLPDNH